MADGIYTAMAGAGARAEQLDSVSDNLANVSSAGFKSERPAFEAFLPQGETGGPASPVAVATQLDLREGARNVTGAPLDATPEHDAFLTVSIGDNAVGFTRNGHLTVSSDGYLTAAGHPVLDTSGNPIVVPPNETVTLSENGVVSVRGTSIGQLATYTLSGGIDRISPSVLGLGAGGTATPASGRVHVGELEMGNYSPMEGVVSMIEAERSFDSAMQAIQTYKAMGARANQLGTVQQQ